MGKPAGQSIGGHQGPSPSLDSGGQPQGQIYILELGGVPPSTPPWSIPKIYFDDEGFRPGPQTSWKALPGGQGRGRVPVGRAAEGAGAGFRHTQTFRHTQN